VVEVDFSGKVVLTLNKGILSLLLVNDPSWLIYDLVVEVLNEVR
jgi:hypothetical protein